MHHLGIAILPEWSAVAGIRSGQLQNLLPDFSIAALPLHAVYPETHWMSLRARSSVRRAARRSSFIDLHDVNLSQGYDYVSLINSTTDGAAAAYDPRYGQGDLFEPGRRAYVTVKFIF